MLAALAAVVLSAASVSGTHAAEATPTALADAAERQDREAIESLIATKADAADEPQPDGMTAAHWAAANGDASTLRTLIEAGLSVDAETIYGETPLTIACAGGAGELVALLVEAGADVNRRTAGDETPLMHAARGGSAEAVEALISAGAEVNALQRRGQTALMWAAAEGHAEVVDVLLRHDADPHIALESGFTALLFAARNGQTAAVDRLLAAGVDVNLAMRPKRRPERAPRDEMSALMLAVESGHFELAIHLVEAGADPNDQRSGFAPLHALSWVRKTKVGDNVDGDPPPRGSGSLTSLQFVGEIVRRGADVNLRLEKGRAGKAEISPKGATPALLAARTGDLPLLKALCEAGADPLIANADAATPLMAAAGVGVTAVGEEPGTPAEVEEVIRWLVDAGADIDAVDENGETAMHGAAYRNYPETVALLASLGADPAVWDRENKYGWTPIEIAQGQRPGSFKPSPETVAALQAAKGE